MSKVVFVGLGAMGLHLARHVAAAGVEHGIPVVGIDRDAAARQRAAEQLGIDVAADAAPLVESGDLVCLSVPDGRVSEAVTQGITAAGVTVLDLSSVSPADARALHTSLSSRGIHYVDAPVTGGVLGAEAGNLTTIVGAKAEEVSDHRWALDAFSASVVFTDQPGNGALLKTINNMVCNLAGLVSMEAIAMARTAGIADDALLGVLNTGTGRTYFSQVRYPTYIATEKFDAGMRIGLVNKDLDIALAAADELGFDLPMGKAGREVWRRALADFGPAGDTTLTLDTVARVTTGRSWAQLTGAGSIPAVPEPAGG